MADPNPQRKIPPPQPPKPTQPENVPGRKTGSPDRRGWPAPTPPPPTTPRKGR